MVVGIIKFVDRFIGNTLCLFLWFYKILKKKPSDTVNNIIVLQFWGIGETVLTLPALKALRQRLPKSKITLLATLRNKDVYECSKNYDNLEIISLSPIAITKFMLKNHNKFDLVIDMEEYLNISAIISLFVGAKRVGYSHGLRSILYTDKVKYNDAQHACKTFLDLIKPLSSKFKIVQLEKLIVGNEDKQAVDNLLSKLGISKKDKVIGIVPGAAESAKSRMWPGDRFARLADKLIENYKSKVFFLGAGYERALIGNIQDSMKNKSFNLAGRISLKQSFYLIEKCSLLISNDTGPMHIAASQGTKTLGLFGPNTPVRFGPFGKHNVALYNGKSCKYTPCVNVHKGQVPDCLYTKRSGNYQKCMKSIAVEDVLTAVKKLI